MKVVVLMFVLKAFSSFFSRQQPALCPCFACGRISIYLTRYTGDIADRNCAGISFRGIVFIHFLLAKKWAFMRYCNILIGGFFLSMLIRELDAFFDLLAHGSWVWFALLSAVCALLYPVIHYRLTLTQLADYTRTPWYGVMLSGLLAVWSSPDCLECTGYGTRYLIKATSG